LVVAIVVHTKLFKEKKPTTSNTTSHI